MKIPADKTARHCKYHCGSCGSHFTSLRAFDLHRFGPWDQRTCWDNEDGLEIVRSDGLCAVSYDQPQIGVTLWRENRPESLQTGEMTPFDGEDGLRAA